MDIPAIEKIESGFGRMRVFCGDAEVTPIPRARSGSVRRGEDGRGGACAPTRARSRRPAAACDFRFPPGRGSGKESTLARSTPKCFTRIWNDSFAAYRAQVRSDSQTDTVHPGYGASDYAQALSEFGTPRELRSRSWTCSNAPCRLHPCVDAMGCYPVFACHDWSRLSEDLEAFSARGQALVDRRLRKLDRADVAPDLRPRRDAVQGAHIYDLTLPPNGTLARSHRRRARRALRRVR